MRMRDFAAGTALGIIPKIALTAFAGNSIIQVLKGEGGRSHIALVAAIGALWLVIGWYARKWLKAREAAVEQERGG
jgi:uncharacterized membrane protein YdjX (TVP38/TMEM64 family)